MRNLKKTLNTSIMMITHDLGVVAEMSDYVLVMYAGMVMEYSDVTTLFDRPLHPYTQGLMRRCLAWMTRRMFFMPLTARFRASMISRAGCRFLAPLSLCHRALQTGDSGALSRRRQKVRCFRYENGLEEDVHNE